MTVKENVYHLLKTDDECRNHDLYLILKYWKEYEGLNVDPGIYENLTSPETIRRNRQKIQNEENKYKPTDMEIREYREKHSA